MEDKILERIAFYEMMMVEVNRRIFQLNCDYEVGGMTARSVRDNREDARRMAEDIMCYAKVLVELRYILNEVRK